MTHRRDFRLILVALAAVVALLATAAVSTSLYLRLPGPTGPFAVGRLNDVWADPQRTEPRVGQETVRRIGVLVWYPAEPGTGVPAPYVPDLDTIEDGLLASGEVGAIEIAGLRHVTTAARAGATPVAGPDRHPVLLLSPGHATNVAFYGVLGEELASQGFVVIGIDHPYQVAAVGLDRDTVAVYAGDGPRDGRVRSIAALIDERLADIAFVLDHLGAGEGPPELAGRIDLERIGILGHSNGGIAAAEACTQDARVAACLNIDGQSIGGPLAARLPPSAPTKAFMYVTKERDLHPDLADLFEAGGRGTYRVVVPAAAHDQFTDTARFVPRFLPVDGGADHVLRVTRGFAVAFFDHELRGAPRSVLGLVDAPTDVFVEVYPLEWTTAQRDPSPTR